MQYSITIGKENCVVYHSAASQPITGSIFQPLIQMML